MIGSRRIVIAGAAYGAGHDAVAGAVADALRRHASRAARVVVTDLLGRCAPRSVGLASLAWRAGEEFFPDATGPLASLVTSASDDPLVRELAQGGLASAEAALRAFEPDAVVATHPVTGAIAAEVARGRGCPVHVVLPEWMPARLWLHPGVETWFVSGTDARDELVRRGIEWARIAVTGVPQDPIPTREQSRAALAAHGLHERFTVLVEGPADRLPGIEDIGASGAQVLWSSGDGAPVRSGSSGTPVDGGDLSRAMRFGAADVVVTAVGGRTLWEPVNAGTPLVLAGPVGRMERPSADLLVNLGAALEARDGADAARRVAFLQGHDERLEALRIAARGLARPLAARAVAERIMDGLA